MCTEEILHEYCERLAEGNWGDIWVVKPEILRNLCPQATSVEELIDEMAENKIDDFTAVVDHLSDNGEHKSHKFRDESDGFKAIALKGEQKQYYRYPAFRIKNNWVVVYGFIKPRKKLWAEKNIDWANTVRTKITSEIKKTQ